jgi:type I restriction enzyme S subunit
MSMTAKSSVDSVRREMIADMLISFPPTKAEQEAITEAMSDADAIVESLEKLIIKKRNIKQGTMQQLLIGKTRLPGFQKKTSCKQTEVGVIPEDWEIIKLGTIADITKLAGFEYSKYFNSYKDGGEIIVIRGTNITHNKLDLTDSKTIPRKTSNVLKRSKLNKGDLVFAYVGTIGPVYLITEDDKYHLGPNTSKISLTDSVSNDFVFWYFNSWLIKNEIVEQTSVGAQPSLSMTKIRRFKILFPPTKDEQTDIAHILSHMDAEIEVLEQKRDKYKDIKQGMMQELLTGKIRLIQQKGVGAPMTTAMKASETTDVSPKKAHNWQINEAVVIAVLTGTFGSEQYPLGRKRYTKFSYLLHRHVEGKAEGYRKKAAGPYNPDTKYKGPEKIAQDNRYIKHHATGKFSGFVADESIEQARKYFDKWYGGEVFQWLEQFRFESNEQLELLTTVDMAVCELAKNKQAVSVKGIKNVIRSHPEWKAKLNRPFFSDESIAAAIEKAQELFGV